MNLRAERVRLGREDRETFDARRFRRRIFRSPPFPKAREGEGLRAAARDEIRLLLLGAQFLPFILKTAVGIGRVADFCVFSTGSCCVSRAQGAGASATDGLEGKLGRLSRGFAASVAGPSTAPHYYLRARAEK